MKNKRVIGDNDHAELGRAMLGKMEFGSLVIYDGLCVKDACLVNDDVNSAPQQFSFTKGLF